MYKVLLVDEAAHEKRRILFVPEVTVCMNG